MATIKEKHIQFLPGCAFTSAEWLNKLERSVFGPSLMVGKAPSDACNLIESSNQATKIFSNKLTIFSL